MNNMSNREKVRELIHKHFDSTVVCLVDPRGWVSEVVMEGECFDQNRTRIRMGKKFGPLFNDILKMSYPVPLYVAGYEVSEEEANLRYSQNGTKNSDVPIYTHFDMPELNAFAIKEVSLFKERKKMEKSLRIDKDYMADIIKQARNEIPKVGVLSEIFVDLVFMDKGTVAVELKSTGDEDGTGAETTLAKRILSPLIAMEDGAVAYFAGITNSKGIKKNGEWAGSLGGWLFRDYIIFEEELWRLVAPSDVEWEEFKHDFTARFRELKEEKCPS